MELTDDLDFEYDLELVPTRHRFGKRFAELTRIAPPSGGVNPRWVAVGAGLLAFWGAVAWWVL